jgi:hypothetical protein
MANVLFISEAFVKDNTLLHENIDFKFIRPVIMLSQDIHLQPKLGSTMFNELKTQIIGGSLTAVNTTLLNDYIQPMLLYWVQAEAPAAISYKFLNKGLMQQSSENSSTASLDEINFIRRSTRTRLSGTPRGWSTSFLRTMLIIQHIEILRVALMSFNPIQGLSLLECFSEGENDGHHLKINMSRNANLKNQQKLRKYVHSQPNIQPDRNRSDCSPADQAVRSGRCMGDQPKGA